MRGGLTVVLVFLVCLVVVVLYIFLGRSQITRANSALQDQNTGLQVQLDQIRAKEAKLPELMARLPQWSRQLAMFEEAIPTKIDDNVFFSNLTKETEKRNVKILKLETSIGDPWLGQITEDLQASLEELGINVNAARNVRIAFYAATLVGDFKDILDVFESMKSYNRLYTLDMITAPATTTMGTSNEVIKQDQTPLTLSGKMYYGISAEEVSQDTLARVFEKAVSGPAARSIFNGVRNSAKEVPEPSPADEETDNGQASAEGGRRELAAVPQGYAMPGGQEGWIR